ncbi:MAG: acyltransferase domain-containing protein, partial [Hymenobacter sp.]
TTCPKSASTGSIMAEWKAWLVASARLGIPCSSSEWAKVATSSSRPATTQRRSVLVAASERLAGNSAASLSLAATNTDRLCVVAGRDEDVAAFAHLLDEQGIPNRVLATSHAFHSAMMDPVLADFGQVVKSVALSRPQIPLVSSVSGTWLTDAQATDPDYWTQHLRRPVRFAEALETIAGLDQPLLLEAGPGSVAATLARQQVGQRAVAVLPGLPPPTAAQSTCQALLQTAGQLWLNGLALNWAAFYEGQARRKVPLPTYAFDRQRCWLDPPAAVSAAAPPVAVVPQATPVAPVNPPLLTPPPPLSMMRKTTLLTKVQALLEDASGLDMAGVTPAMSLLEIGLDSLLLTQ